MKISKFPQVKQLFGYDCGAKALESIFSYYCLDEDYRKIIKVAGTDSNGTKIKGMEKALRVFGFNFKSAQISIGELKKYLQKKIPVIVLLQAWPDKKVLDWKNTWDTGHYVVAIGFDKKKVYFEDPWCEQMTFLTFEELSDRWHDSVRGRKYQNHGLAVFGRKKHLPSTAIHMS